MSVGVGYLANVQDTCPFQDMYQKYCCVFTDRRVLAMAVQFITRCNCLIGLRVILKTGLKTHASLSIVFSLIVARQQKADWTLINASCCYEVLIQSQGIRCSNDLI